MPQFDVFLSHNSIDKAWARQLKADLNRYGLSAWLDEDEIRPGDSMVRALEEALEQSRAVALIVSPEAMASGWVREEYDRAVWLAQDRGRSLQLIPVILRTAELPGFLQSRNRVDFRNETAYAENVWKLAWGITGVKPPQVLDLSQGEVAGLTRDDIPAPTPLPPGSRPPPFSPNPLFVGREAELRALAQALVKGEQAVVVNQVAAVTGLGGIGKTQLASEFVHRYGPYFAGGVFWLNFANPDGIPTEVTACGGPGALELYTEASGLKLEEQVAKVRAAWQSPLPRLLVFDNCEEEALLAEWRPTTGGCRVLVTSRRANWDKSLGVQTLPLGVLPRSKSIELLRKFRPDLGADDPDLNALAEEVGDLPLALHLAGNYLKTYQADMTPAEYLAELQGRAILAHESLQGIDLTVSSTNHDLHVGRTFALSYDKLKREEAVDRLALTLLSRAAYFAPGEPIPRELLLATVALPDKAGQHRANSGLKHLFNKLLGRQPQLPDTASRPQINRALKRLVALGLLDEEAEGAVVMHRLVAAFGQSVAEAGAQGAVEETLIAEANRINNAGYPARLLAWQSHLRAVTEAAQRRGDAGAASLCNSLGYHLWMIGDYVGARPYFERALAISEQVLGPAHPDTALSLNNLGSLLQDLGDLAGARPYFERALAIKEQVLGPEHPDTAASLNNLGGLLHALGDLAGARPYYERALAINEQVLGPAHPDTARSLWWLGTLLLQAGDHEGARPPLQRALAIFEQTLGPEHPHTRGVHASLAKITS